MAKAPAKLPKSKKGTSKANRVYVPLTLISGITGNMRKGWMALCKYVRTSIFSLKSCPMKAPKEGAAPRV